jgi:hypothetical protein
VEVVKGNVITLLRSLTAISVSLPDMLTIWPPVSMPLIRADSCMNPIFGVVESTVKFGVTIVCVTVVKVPVTPPIMRVETL